MRERCTCHPGFMPHDLSELCPWCKRLRIGTARIEAALGSIGADHRPRAGWDASVLASSKERIRERRTFGVAVIVGVAIAVGLAAIAAWIAISVWRYVPIEDRPLELDIRIDHGGHR